MSMGAQMESYEAAPIHTVLILGDGEHALRLALELSTTGFGIVVAEWTDGLNGPAELLGRLKERDGVELLAGARITGLSGDLGCFEARFVQGRKRFSRTVAAVAVVPEPVSRELFEAWNLVRSENVAAISRIENDELPESVRTVLLLDHPEGRGFPWQTARLLRAAALWQKPGDRQCYLVSPQMKVAEQGLERFYRQARDAGVIVIRPDDARVERNPDGVTLTYEDPLLDMRLVLTPDRTVVGEEDTPSRELNGLAEALHVNRDPYGWLQENNVMRLPVSSNRLGVFVVGAAAGPVSPAGLEAAVMVASQEISRVLKIETEFLAAPKIEVDRDRCAHCLTCYRLCPHGAISWKDKPLFSPISCQGCGICASECPAEALTLMGFEPSEIRSRIGSPKESGGKPRVVVLACEKSGVEAFDSLPEDDRRSLNVTMVGFPCAGNIKTAFMLNAFHLGGGADGVLVLGCHLDNCKSSTGTVYARRKVEVVKNLLESIGWEPNRIRFYSLASNMGAKLYKEIKDFQEKLATLKPPAEAVSND